MYSFKKNNKCINKYQNVRSELITGDIILYRGNSIMSKLIQYFDRSYHNHVGVIWKEPNSGRFLTFDMWSSGLDLIPLSRRIENYEDFCIIRPMINDDIKNDSIYKTIRMWEGRKVKYDYWLLLRIAIIKKFGIDITNLGKKDKFICSEYVRKFVQDLGIATYNDINLITPEDFLRKIDQNIFDIKYR